LGILGYYKVLRACDVFGIRPVFGGRILTQRQLYSMLVFFVGFFCLWIVYIFDYEQ